MVREISFEDISYMPTPFSAEKNNLCNSVEDTMWNISVNNFKFGPVVQEDKSFKEISNLEFWQPL